ncbi:MAG: type II toxin-antitoxin system Phd/YefM family antitoxin [Verrucomicrobiota bacterium]
MTTLKLSEAKAHLGSYARKAAEGEHFIIADRNRPIAMLSPCDDDNKGVQPILGLMKEQASIPDDFDAPMEPFENDFYAG